MIIKKDWISLENGSNKITIGIITGINKYNPYWYRVIIGENILSSGLNKENEPTFINYINRLHTMEAKNDININILKQAISKHNKFNFLPILLKDIKDENLRTELSIIKESNSIIIKDVCEIDENDSFLINGLMPIDKPVNKTGKELFAEKIIKEKQKIQKY